RRVIELIPIDSQTAEVALADEIDLEPLLLGSGLASPAGFCIVVERALGRVICNGARRMHLRGATILAGRFTLLELEIVDPYRSLAAVAAGDRELDRAHPLRHRRSSPGERDPRLADRDLLPLGRERVVALHPPPDVLTGRVDELEL